ncbi:poly-gamma-glutamate system protein [Wenzhouxiangella sp. XN201]|uniref:poly-gamma-glutamate system protein n=1 Tax=Wenzhouxiangella sp. XN201 TaxID=2710755 RepID=UPI0013C59697|nr:poly-gamma-glutamate system protein [Wenzhouxiangella sp. XN201]NEZ03765.1 poly-gamma-glutamate system protein [Wenzhouxiangella sp. XN201]
MRARPQKLYWRPSSIPTPALLLLALAAVAALLVVETFTRQEASDYYSEMLDASRLVQQSIEVLRPIRGRVEPINPDVDPLRSGLIGIASSPLTSNSGDLESKQATINPNWAAVVIRLLAEAGVEPGDRVGVAVSGSFPALNLAVYTALQSMGVEATTVVSGSASQWGANIPGFAWLDITRELRDAQLIDIKADAVTLGGIEDRGVGLDRRAIEMITESAQQAGIELIVPDSYEEAVAERIRIYNQGGSDKPLAALINVGGGTATTGPNIIDHFFGSGLNRTAPSAAFRVPSVMGHFLQQEIPVINFSGIRNLATQYGLPYPPERMESIGTGGVYRAESYRRWLAALMIVLLLGLTALIMRSANIALVTGRRGSRSDTMKPKV